MSGAQVSVSTSSEPVATPVEVVADQAAIAEVHADAAVEVAQIQADRDVAIAETHAEVAAAAIEAEADEDDEEWETLLQNIEALRTEHSALLASVSSIQARLEKLEAPPSPPPDLPKAEDPTNAASEPAPEPPKAKKPSVRLI